MTTVIFESHGTTVDNERGIASAWPDAVLSSLGEHQARELGERYRDAHLDAVFVSDLSRSYRTAEIAFAGRPLRIVRDARLRECDYGTFTGGSSEVVLNERGGRVSVPFPNGESYEQAAARMRRFLDDLLRDYDGTRVLIIGHRATQYGLEHWINQVPLKKAVTDPWRWQPGWVYELKRVLPVCSAVFLQKSF